ncbi:hypothetical protein CSB45_06765 [candidate division KSB3 bacterium]|uniref:Response regulatory domain-containing protein n=1 Tax=candidate division KSB3 bacterium TaxID=2044937 RepID=A0A2G6E626_9BACT|nr:MAG: hypothetical protein CSB45_06765 [candidate division KSB3 bacterium]PIE30063.1 MAG: hypothetical protein CSA57_05830 [candidate division KSB3 bacterium]
MATVLVIDDSVDARNLTRQILSKEHNVLTIDSWVYATEYIFKHDVDLILLDINMPGLSGDKLAGVLKKSVKIKEVNIVLFSSIDEGDLRRKAIETGVLGYIPKTFEGNLLRTRVRKFLKKIGRE